MSFEDIADGGIENLIADFSELTLISIETSGRILLREFHGQVDNDLADPRSASFFLPSIGGVPFLGHECPMPSHHRVECE